MQRKTHGTVNIIAIFAFVFGIMFCVSVSTAGAVLPIDVTGSTLQIDGPQVITLRNVSAYGNKYWLQFKWNENTLNWDIVTGGEETAIDPNMVAAQKLLGHWQFTFTIGTYTAKREYTMSNIKTDIVNSEGGYSVVGVDEYGDMVLGSHYPAKGFYALLDPSSTIDLFYVFYINGNTASGCYYQISHSTGSISNCYSMNGVKSSARFGCSDNEHGLDDLEIQRLVEMDSADKNRFEIDPEHRQIYEDLKAVFTD